MDLSDFIVDQLRRSRTSDIADQVSSGQLAPNDALLKLAQATGDPEALQKGSALKMLQTSDLNSPDAVENMYKTGQITGEQLLNYKINPMVALKGLVGGDQPSALQQLAAPQDSQVAPAPVAAPDTAAAPAPDTPQAPKMSGVDYNYLTQAKRQFPAAGIMAENMISGVFNPESGKGENDPIYNAALLIARRADPTFTPQSLIGRPQMVKNATSGKMYTDSMNLNSVAGHLYDLHAAAPGLQNGPSIPVNWWRNTATTLLGTGGNKDISQYESILGRAAPELNKFYVGGEGDKEGRAAAGDPFSSSNDPDVIQNNIRTQLGLLKSKAGSLQNEYNTTMGAAANKSIISPMSQALMDDIDGKPLTDAQKKLVNAHRLESNLPMKKWDNSAPNKPQAEQKPQITKEQAIAELRARGKIK